MRSPESQSSPSGCVGFFLNPLFSLLRREHRHKVLQEKNVSPLEVAEKDYLEITRHYNQRINNIAAGESAATDVIISPHITPDEKTTDYLPPLVARAITDLQRAADECMANIMAARNSEEIKKYVWIAHKAFSLCHQVPKHMLVELELTRDSSLMRKLSELYTPEQVANVPAECFYPDEVPMTSFHRSLECVSLEEEYLPDNIRAHSLAYTETYDRPVESPAIPGFINLKVTLSAGELVSAAKEHLLAEVYATAAKNTELDQTTRVHYVLRALQGLNHDHWQYFHLALPEKVGLISITDLSLMKDLLAMIGSSKVSTLEGMIEDIQEMVKDGILQPAEVFPQNFFMNNGPE